MPAMPQTSHTALMARMNDGDYLRAVERLAHDVVDRAVEEGWLSIEPDPPGATALQRAAVNELARSLRFVHFDGDGCAVH
jgi:hypothetical protein